jgi:hypothetical protein
MKRRIAGFSLLVVLTGVMTGCASSGLSLGPHAIKLVLAFKQGQVYRYNVSFTLNGSTTTAAQSVPTNASMTATEVMTATSVDNAGIATIDITLENATMTINGRSTPLTGAPTHLQMKVGRDGRIVSGGALAGGAGAAPSIPGTNQLTPLLPDHDIKPGDTWTKQVEQPNPFGTGTISASTTNKYLRDQAFNGHQDAVIESKSTVPLNLTFDYATMARNLGLTSQLSRFPQLASLQVTYSGSATGDTTAELNKATGEMDATHMIASFEATMTFVGSAGSPRAGQTIPFKGNLTVDLKRV